MTWKLDRKYKNGGPVPENYLGGLAPPVIGLMKLTEVEKMKTERKETYQGLWIVENMIKIVKNQIIVLI